MGRTADVSFLPPVKEAGGRTGVPWSAPCLLLRRQEAKQESLGQLAGNLSSVTNMSLILSGSDVTVFHGVI